MMTTEEAATKWCPMRKDREAGVTNCCISTNCMAWRWRTKYVQGEGYENTNQGYCGLAGKE